MAWIVWLLIAVMALVGEALTTDLLLASVAVAAFVAAGLSALAPVVVQIVAFGLLSVVLLGAVRPAVLRLLPSSGSGQELPRIGPVGQQALAVERIDGRQGMIRIGSGEFWSARPLESGLVIDAGSEVEVVRMEGLTARVRSLGAAPAAGETALIPEVALPAAPEREADEAAEVRTFLFADVRGYTSFTHEHGDEAGARLVERFAELTRERVALHGGRVVELRGDEALATFVSPRKALRAAVDLQSRLVQEAQCEPMLPLMVGMGIDAGEAVAVEGGYRGGALNLGARLCALAQPGEILASEEVVHLAGRLDGLVYLERKPAQLKGIPEPVRVVQVLSRTG